MTCPPAPARLPTLDTKTPCAKKHLTFAYNIEQVCSFVSARPPSDVATGNTLLVQDTDDWSLPNVSAARVCAWTCSTDPAVNAHPNSADKQVWLAGCHIVNHRFLKLVVHVRNTRFEKRVSVRYTLDQWATHDERHGRHISALTSIGGINSSAGPDPLKKYDSGVDVFEILLDIPELATRQCAESALKADQDPQCLNMEYALRFQTNHNDSWDNNCGENYQVLILIT